MAKIELGDADLGSLLFGEEQANVGEVLEFKDVTLQASVEDKAKVELTCKLPLDKGLKDLLEAVDPDVNLGALELSGSCSGDLSALPPKLSARDFRLTAALPGFDVSFTSDITLDQVAVSIAIVNAEESDTFEWHLSFLGSLTIKVGRSQCTLDTAFEMKTGDDGPHLSGTATLDKWSNAFGIKGLMIADLEIEFEDKDYLEVKGKCSYAGLDFELQGSTTYDDLNLSAIIHDLTLREIGDIADEMGLGVSKNVSFPDLNLMKNQIQIVVSKGNSSVSLESTIEVNTEIFSGTVSGKFQFGEQGVSMSALLETDSAPSSWSIVPDSEILELSRFGVGFIWKEDFILFYGSMDLNILKAVEFKGRAAFVRANNKNHFMVTAQVDVEQKSDLMEKLDFFDEIPILGELVESSDFMIAFANSKFDLPEGVVSGGAFDGALVLPGLSFMLSTKMPSQLDQIFKRPTLIISANFRPTTVSVRGQMPTIYLGDAVDKYFEFKKVDLVAEAGAGGAAFGIELASTFKIFDKEIDVEGRLKVTESTIEGALLVGDDTGVQTDITQEEAIWDNVAFIKDLDLISLKVSIGYQFAALLGGKIGAGGKIRFGDIGGAIEFNLGTDPSDLVMAATLQNFAPDQFAQMLVNILPNVKLNVKDSIPSVIEIHTFMFAFASIDTDNYKQGVSFLLDAELFDQSIEIEAHALPTSAELKMLGKLEGFDLGPLSVTNADGSDDPVELRFEVSPSSLLALGANVKVTVLDLEAGVNMDASQQHVNFDGFYDVFNITKGQLSFKSSLEVGGSDSFIDADFDIRIKVEGENLKTVAKELKKILESTYGQLDDIGDDIQELNRKIQEVGLAGAKRAVERLEDAVDDAKEFLASAEKEFKKTEKELKTSIARVDQLLTQSTEQLDETVEELANLKRAKVVQEAVAKTAEKTYSQAFDHMLKLSGKLNGLVRKLPKRMRKSFAISLPKRTVYKIRPSKPHAPQKKPKNVPAVKPKPLIMKPVKRTTKKRMGRRREDNTKSKRNSRTKLPVTATTSATVARAAAKEQERKRKLAARRKLKKTAEREKRKKMMQERRQRQEKARARMFKRKA